MFSRLARAWRRLDPARDDAARLDTIRPATWCLDHASIAGSRLTIGGWMLRASPVDVTFSINGRRFEEQHFGESRPDLVPLYSFVSDAAHGGFQCSTMLTPGEAFGQETIRIDLAALATLGPLRDQQAFYVPVDSMERWPLPDATRMRRVHGNGDAASFRIVGYSNLHKLDWALRRTTGGGLESRRRILDWGCGCGRLLRYCADLPGVSLTGADIDADNVAWCQAHLPFASLHLIPLHPPTDFPAGAFDLIVGISIFTHLTEAVQHEWLRELQRLVAPGGVVAVTIHGLAVAATGGPEVWRLVNRGGFLDTRSHDLDEVLPDPSYYRTTLHSPDYVRREWSRYFDIVDIMPACIGNAQDLVILRPRSSR